MMRKDRIIAWVLLAVFMVGCGQTAKVQSPMDEFQPGFHSSGGSELAYHLFDPTKNRDLEAQDHLYPLVLALHGRGERLLGSCDPDGCGAPQYMCHLDERAHLRFHPNATAWATKENQARHPAFVVAPRIACPSTWIDTSVQDALLDLLDTLVESYPIDTTRIYVTGLSLGGEGTFALVARDPGRFAAAVPMSGWGDPQMAVDFEGVPMWVFHGLGDKTILESKSKQIVTAIQDLGYPVVYDECPLNTSCPVLTDGEKNADHLYTVFVDGRHVIWKEAYGNPALVEWVFSKTSTH